MGISGIKSHFISPLAGTTVSNLFIVLKGNRVAPRYYGRFLITFIFASTASLLSCVDRWWFRKRTANYSIKESPVFIIGFWRSGGTFLHQLLSMDPAAGFVSTYQSVFPNNLKSKWLFRPIIKMFIPCRLEGDPMKWTTDLPQDDEFALCNSTHQSFYNFFYFPSRIKYCYNEYIRFTTKAEHQQLDWTLIYRNMVIKSLINTNGKRANLYNPANTGRIPILQDLFPKARFIFVIRNPVIVYLSAKKFFSEFIPTLQMEKYSSDKIADMTLDLYELLLKDYLSDKALVNPDRIIEIRFEQLVQHPQATLEKLYSAVSIDYTEDSMLSLAAYPGKTNHSHQEHYSILRQELDKILPRIEFAMQHWNYEIPENLMIVNNSDRGRNPK